ncbi:YaaA family protein [bacterium]|nr:YaaA family protein [bacterium]
MLYLLNTTKLMDLEAPVPPRLRATAPAFADEAADLIDALRPLPAGRLATLMDLNADLARRTRADLALWGDPDRPAQAAVFAFTGLVYKHLDAGSWDAAVRRRAQKQLRILSGLYGVLRPLDRIQAYRLEMGCRWAPPGARNLTEFWRDRITAALNAELRDGEPVVSTASQEYLKAVDETALRGRLITPVFKERDRDGTLKTRVVHAKMARGALIRHGLTVGARKPKDLLGFRELGWEAAEPPPERGPWLFTRPLQV